MLSKSAGAAVGGAKTTGGLAAIGITAIGLTTLIRTRGMLSVHMDPTSVDDVLLCGFGLGLYTSDAFSAGVASMPGPLSDVDWDWIWHKTLILGPNFTATESGEDILQNLWIDVDSKAMRKVKDNMTLGWVAEGEILSGGGTFNYSVVARHGFKLG